MFQIRQSIQMKEINFIGLWKTKNDNIKDSCVILKTNVKTVKSQIVTTVEYKNTILKHL